MQYEITANVPGQWYILVKGNHNEPPVALFYELDAAEAFIVSLGAGVQQQTTTDAARDVKRYHGRTIEDLKEICTTRPARYPQAHHDFDKTILALIAEIERLDRAKGE